MEIELDKVYTIKLLNGQEFIAKIVDKDDNNYHLDSALTLGQGQNGGMELFPAAISADIDSPALMPISAVAIVLPTGDDAGDAYRESISGVVVPKKKILMS